MSLPYLKLNDGKSIPMMGFGTGTTWFKDDPNEEFDAALVEVLKTAIQRGFRHIDCSDRYGTEKEVGLAIKECGVPRDQLFITTKTWDGIYNIPTAFESSLSKLGLEYVDLYLIHNPYKCLLHTPDTAKAPLDLGTAWRAMERLKASGQAKSIGVSNHQQAHLEEILKVATIKPAINQLEFHPYLQRSDYVCWMREEGIQVASFYGLTPITKARPGPLDELLANIATKHGVTENAVLIKWQMDQGVVPVTTTRNPDRLSEYMAAIDLKLTDDEREEISQIGLSHHFRAWYPHLFEHGDIS